MDCLDRYRGCLLGGAAGDALGYPVEFDRRADILQAYGPRGITDYALMDGVAQISDDTQMTLFTANALLWQLCYCGPLVRLIFRTIFREKKQ